MLSLRLGRVCLLLALAFVITAGVEFADAQTTQQTQAALKKKLQQLQQQQQQANKNKNKNKLPPQNQPPATALPATGSFPAVGLPGAGLPGKTPLVKYEDKDVEFTVAEDAAVQRLQKFDTGLNFVDAKLSDVVEGQRVTFSSVKGEGEKKDVQHVSGVVVKVTESGTKVTLRLSLAVGQDVDNTKPIQQVSIRSLPDSK